MCPTLYQARGALSLKFLDCIMHLSNTHLWIVYCLKIRYFSNHLLWLLFVVDFFPPSVLFSFRLCFQVVGLKTNIKFLLNLARHPEFVFGNVHTDFIQQHEKELFVPKVPSHTDICSAVLSILLSNKREAEKIKTEGIFSFYSYVSFEFLTND